MNLFASFHFGFFKRCMTKVGKYGNFIFNFKINVVSLMLWFSQVLQSFRLQLKFANN